MLDNIAKRWVTTTLLLSYRSTLLRQPYQKHVHSILDKKQRYSVFSLLFFLGRTTAINYSTFLPIAYRWWDFFYFVIDMKKQCTVFKAKTIARWYVLIKLIVILKGRKLWISNYSVVWRDGTFVFEYSRFCCTLLLLS